MKAALHVLLLLLGCYPVFVRAQCPSVNLGADTALCSGSYLTLNADNPGATYTWSTGSTANTIDVYTAGKYHVAVTMNGCTVRDTITVSLSPLLWNDFSATKVADCAPVMYQFTDKSTTCSGSILGWYWEFGDGTTSALQNPVHAFYSSGQYNVRLTITDDQGNTSRRTRRVNVTITSFTVNLGKDTTICEGNPLLLDAFVTGASYLWNTGETTSSISPASGGDYDVAVSKNGCTIRDTIRISARQTIHANWGYLKGEACLPVRVQFSDSSTTSCNQQVATWFWDFGDGSFSTLQHPVHHYVSTDSFNVRLTTTTANGSQSTKSARIGITNTAFTLELGDNMMVCRGDSLQLNANLQQATYQWSPALHMDDPLSASPKVSPSTHTWYRLEATRCQVTVTDSILILVDSLPTPYIIQADNMLKTQKAVAYQWLYNGVNVAGATRDVMRIDRSGFYSVRLFNNNGCDAVSAPTFFMPVQRSYVEEDSIVITCSPNPTRGPFNIIVSELPQQPFKLSVYDRYGRSVHTVYVHQHITPVVITNITRGMYFAEATINKKKRIIPIVVQ